ncbi:MAG: hypothetical protein KAQ94_04650 [Arcobacteraceae bacterium]|nr:hypothetical protein [Arcobacteraceae bacterium]
MKKIILGLSIVTASLLANDNFITDGAPGLKIGTLGAGVEYTSKYNDKLDLRLGVNYYSHKDSGTKSDINYDINLKLQTVAAIADYHVFNNGFILSAGVMLNNNELNFDARSSATYNIDGTVYTAAQVGTLKGQVKFNRVSPYVGIGYSGATKSTGWSFTAELGALYQGNAKVDLSTTSNNASVIASVENEEEALKNELDGLKWYPVLSIGVVYKF